MEINITNFFNNATPVNYFASQLEAGDNAGQATWQAANDAAGEYMLLDTLEKRAAFRTYARMSGGWTDAEIAAWSDAELNALFIQFVASEMREGDLAPDMTGVDWLDYEMRSHAGQVAGSIFRADDGEIYFSLY